MFSNSSKYGFGNPVAGKNMENATKILILTLKF